MEKRRPHITQLSAVRDRKRGVCQGVEGLRDQGGVCVCVSGGGVLMVRKNKKRNS